eukprot:7279699-Alexandrium_andersonii.AAC.1
MSASLVGSEMCIRDSLQGVSVERSACERGRTLGIHPAARVRGLEGGPVSYTHLTLPTICSV